MRLTRGERRDRTRIERRRLYTAVGLLCVGVFALAVPAVFLGERSDRVGPTPAGESTSTPVTAPAVAGLPIEVPDVTGEPLAQAEVVLTFAGFRVDRTEVVTAPPNADRVVLAQDPSPGELAARGSSVALMHAPAPATASAPKEAPERRVVCIDPGHQMKSDQRPEPIGPGATETKMRVTGGTTGVLTGKPEYVLTLELAERLRSRLRAAGVEVVMTRTAHDVSISNAERAQIANRAGADLFVRLHADGNTDRTMHGLSTLHPERNGWTAPIADRSLRAARAVHASALRVTGAADKGIVARGDMTGFNWAKVPAIIVECGFMSNPDEDALLASPAYQDKLAEGIANGVLAYLEGE